MAKKDNWLNEYSNFFRADFSKQEVEHEHISSLSRLKWVELMIHSSLFDDGHCEAHMSCLQYKQTAHDR